MGSFDPYLSLGGARYFSLVDEESRAVAVEVDSANKATRRYFEQLELMR
jgi:hypothetical protein